MDESRGFWTYYCKNCASYHNVYFGCNSRLCSCCGKRYADHWAEKLVENTFDVPHKHAVFGLPPLLWNELRYHRSAWKVVMDSVIETMKWFYHETCGNVKPGVITVLHPFGRDIGFKLHVHALVTKGGFDNKGDFIEWNRYVPFKKLHKRWMYIVCGALKEHFPKNASYTQLFDKIWNQYGKEGFIVELCKPTLYNKKQLARYVARYVRHPAIADSRILYFDDKSVAFYYICHKTQKKEFIVMKIDEFIEAIIQHVPESQFKMIRYYGAYARRTKKIYAKHLLLSIKNKFPEFESNSVLRCPDCDHIMEKVYFNRGKPPPDKSKLDGWM